MKCTECGKTQDTSRFNPECGSPSVCFKCRVSTVKLGFGGHREFFHNDTIKGFQERQIKEARDNGLDPVPAWHVTNTGTTAGGMQRLQDHHRKLAAKNDAK